MSNNAIDITITGKQTLDNLVDGLSKIDKDKAIKSGLSKGGAVIKKGGMRRLRQRMKVGSKGQTGNLLRSFTTRVKKFKPGVLIGFRQGKDGGNHSHLVDLGTVERIRKRKSKKAGGKGGHTGAARPNYFWSETKEADMYKAKEEMETGISQFVEKVKTRL